jgi:hypothetical protein
MFKGKKKKEKKKGTNDHMMLGANQRNARRSYHE